MSYDGLVSYLLDENKMANKMTFILWDVGNGLSIWIKTPNGHNHWIDAGSNNGNDFSPAKHVYENHKERNIDYLIISHPHKDHIENLPDLVGYFGKPRVLCRNRSLPANEKYGHEQFEYQKVYKSLDIEFNNPISHDAPISPQNSDYNGGIEITNGNLDYYDGIASNNTSVVVFYYYADHLFVCPGDIEPAGWIDLWAEESENFSPIIEKAKHRILVAPHHGRESGYSQEMMDAINPHLVLIADKWGGGETDRRYRENPLGLDLNGSKEKYKSTKTDGRLKFTIREDGVKTFTEV